MPEGCVHPSRVSLKGEGRVSTEPANLPLQRRGLTGRWHSSSQYVWSPEPAPGLYTSERSSSHQVIFKKKPFSQMREPAAGSSQFPYIPGMLSVRCLLKLWVYCWGNGILCFLCLGYLYIWDCRKKKKNLNVLMSILALAAGSLMAEILISLFIPSSLPFRVPARAWLLVSWLQYLDGCGWHW